MTDHFTCEDCGARIHWTAVPRHRRSERHLAAITEKTTAKIEGIRERSLQPLAAWMHEHDLGCHWQWNDPAHASAGRHHTGDHDREASEFLAALSAAR
jgi:hypothetical protein